jgi:hypothetical protein
MSTVQDFDSSLNLMSAILWQYEDAEKLKSIISAKQSWINRNQKEFWINWYRDVFNIDTANSFGLSVWSRILNVPLKVDVQPQKTKVAFGFGQRNANMNNGNFGVDKNQSQSLTLEQQRIVIKFRYFQLTSRCTVPEINRFMSEMFGREGTAYVFDPKDMSFVLYTFGFAPNSQLQFILDEFDLLPRPAGVGVKWQVRSKPSFGFGNANLNFNNGNFGA